MKDNARPVRQAGAVAFRVAGDRPEILLVRAKKVPTQWVFPKGHLSKGEKRRTAALRELQEEAGVVGHVVRPLVPVLKFTSGTEEVEVKYFLVIATGEAKPDEVRETIWLAPDAAIQKLTHPDAQTLLRAALPDVFAETALYAARQAAIARPDEVAFREFLLEEYQHTADSLLRNEEDGEKRASFFLGLTGAAGTALAFVLGNDASFGPNCIEPLLSLALAVLLVIGHFTFVRVVHRNLASDRYKRALNRVRRYFVEHPGDPRVSFLAFDPFTREPRPPVSWRSFGRGGWLETVAAIQSLIAAALAASLAPTSAWGWDALVGGVIAAAAWIALLADANRRLAKG